MIVFTSDHGEEFCDHGHWLHGHSLYNELIKVPLIIKFPYNNQKNVKVRHPISLLDIMPTILEELHIDYSKQNFDGKRIDLFLKNQNKRNPPIISEIYGKVKDKAPFKHTNRYLRKTAIFGNRYKLVCSICSQSDFPISTNRTLLQKNLEMELFDLEKDPYEKINIAHQKKKLVQHLLNSIKDFYEGKSKELLKTKNFSLRPELIEELKALGYIK
jgi:arylsulfatase A-like enzyme